MSEITTRIAAYVDGGRKDWPALRDWLADYDYVTPKRYDDGDPVRHALDGDDWDNPHVDGSWDEVRWAWAGGDISNDQYLELNKQIVDATK